MTTQAQEEAVEFRQRLLEGMAAAIRECGYGDSTVADVVRHARTSRRTFYEHFPSKQACYIALLQECAAETARQIVAAVDPRARWDAQVRQAIEAWIAVSRSDLPVTLSLIRDLPSLGSQARQLQRESLEEFVVLVQTLTDTPELRAAGVAPPPRQLTIMLLGGLRELLAMTVEDGGDIGDITEVAVQATQAMLRSLTSSAPLVLLDHAPDGQGHDRGDHDGRGDHEHGARWQLKGEDPAAEREPEQQHKAGHHDRDQHDLTGVQRARHEPEHPHADSE